MTAPASPDVCLSCGYDLTGLADNMPCPECAFPIARSRERSPLLRTADPAWLARIHRGLLNYTWSATALLGCYIGALALVLISEAIGTARHGILSWLMKSPVLLALAYAAVLHAAACVRLGAATYGGFSLGPAARAALRAGGLLIPWCVAYTAAGLVQAVGSPTVIGLIHAAFQFTASAFLFALAAILRNLESRTPAWSPALRRRHTNVRKNLIGALIILGFVYWLPAVRRGFSAGVSDWGIALFAIAYVCMASAVSRVRTAVALELAIANAAPNSPTPAPRSP